MPRSYHQCGHIALLGTFFRRTDVKVFEDIYERMLPRTAVHCRLVFIFSLLFQLEKMTVIVAFILSSLLIIHES